MTATVAFKQSDVRRAIAAARKEGLHVLAIRPDGTVVVGDHPVTFKDVVPPNPLNEDDAERAEWEKLQT